MQLPGASALKRKLRIFVSSPGDVGRERRIAGEVIERLDAEFGDAVQLEPFFWEYEPTVITKDYQEEIPPPSQFDIVICILWTRLGSRPLSTYRLPGGAVAQSGTEYELVDAEAQFRAKGVPDILVWFNTSSRSVQLDDVDVLQWREQLDRLNVLLEKWTQDDEEQVFKGAINRYEKLEEFEERLEITLRKVVKQRLGGDAAEARPRARWPGNPYRGLHVFEYEHGSIFFGRTAAIADATRKLREQIGAVWREQEMAAASANQGSNGDAVDGSQDGARPHGARAFTLIFGASGSGKSSLARAGVLPMLVNGNAIEGVGLWRCAIMKPSDGAGDLMKALANALVEKPAAQAPVASAAAGADLHPAGSLSLRPMAVPELLANGSSVASIAHRLQSHPEAAADLVQGALSGAASVSLREQESTLQDLIEQYRRDGRVEDVAVLERRLAELRPPRVCLALLLDQLEELFTTEYPSDAIRRFLRAVDALAASGRVVVVATLRSEFFVRCAEYPDLLRLKDQAGTVHLAAPQADELAQVIRKPAQAAGVLFDDTPQKGSLNERILKAAIRNPDCLPLLEFCLENLYEQGKAKGLIEHQAYEDMGQLEGVLTQRAEQVFTRLIDETPAGASAGEVVDETLLFSVIDALATIDEAESASAEQPKLVRRVVSYEELTDATIELHGTPAARRLVDAFIAARLFKIDSDAENRRIISVTHEALLRNWDRVKGWLNKEETLRLIRVRAYVEQRLKQWQDVHSRGQQFDDGSYLLPPGRELDEAKAQLDWRPRAFSHEARAFINESLAAAAAREFRECLQAGDEEQMLACSQRIEAAYPQRRLAVFKEVLRAGKPRERRHAAQLLGQIAPGELCRELIRLVVEDADESVRRMAAYSLMRLDQVEPCAEIAAMAQQGDHQSAALGALARILVAADMQVSAPQFDRWFASLPWLRRREVRVQSWWLRLRMAVPVFFAVIIPATILAMASSMAFKWMPGLLNYAYGQESPSAIKALFHGGVAALFMVGGSTFGLAFFRMVLGREHGTFKHLRPFGAIVSGALFGALGGLGCDIAIATVFEPRNLWIMGWIPTESASVGADIFVRNFCGLIFMLNGMGIGMGMALITNRLRGSEEWKNFLGAQSKASFADLQQIRKLLGGLLRLALPFGWPLPAALALTSALGLLLLVQADMPPTTDTFTGGLPEVIQGKFGGHLDDHEVAEKMRQWKRSMAGRVLGIGGDSTAMVISGFFGIVGMGFGIVILRCGISLEPRRRAG
jgi:hypothetical protein